MLIVVNDTDEIDYDPVSGNAHKEAKLRIPTIFVSKSVGDKLMNFVSGDLTDQKKSVILEFTLPLPTTDVVKLGFVLSAIDKKAITLISNFREQVKHLDAKLEMEFLWWHDQINKSDYSQDELKRICLDENPEACLIDIESPHEVIKAQEFLECNLEHSERQDFLEYLEWYDNKCLNNKMAAFARHTKKDGWVATCSCGDGSQSALFVEEESCMKKSTTDINCRGGTIGTCTQFVNAEASTDVYCPFREDEKNLHRVVHTHGCAKDAHDEYLKYKLTQKKMLDKVKSPKDHAKSDTNKKCLENQEKTHELFLKTQSKIKKAGVYVHPTVMINGKAIYGNLNAKNVFNAVCEAYLDPPAICAPVQDKYAMSEEIGQQIKSHSRRLTNFWIANVLTLLVIFMLAGAIFYFVFKKMYKNVISHQIDGMVRDTMASYNRIDDM